MEVTRQQALKEVGNGLKGISGVLGGIFVPSSLVRQVENEDRKGLLDTSEKRRINYQ